MAWANLVIAKEQYGNARNRGVLQAAQGSHA
jgi:hypothetical protein